MSRLLAGDGPGHEVRHLPGHPLRPGAGGRAEVPLPRALHRPAGPGGGCQPDIGGGCWGQTAAADRACLGDVPPVEHGGGAGAPGPGGLPRPQHLRARGRAGGGGGAAGGDGVDTRGRAHVRLQRHEHRGQVLALAPHRQGLVPQID